jgi:hypothetical protein
MKYKLAITPVLVTALTVAALAVHTGGSPAGAAAAPATWDLEAFGPKTTDDVVLKWNEQLLATIRTNPAATGPTVTSRALGVLQTAVYDAWAAYDPVAKGTRLGSQLRRPAGERTLANKSKAISYAAYRTLSDLFGDPKFKRADFPTAHAAYDAQMAALGYPIDTTTMDNTPQGIGNRAAKALLDFRHADGSNQLNGYVDTTGYQPKNAPAPAPVTAPMNWQPQCVLTDQGVAHNRQPAPSSGTCDTASGDYVIQKATTPQWGTMTAFAQAGSYYRVAGPPKDPDGVYNRAEVLKEVADAANLDDLKKSQAEYWADGPKSEFPPGHNFVFAQAISRHSGFSLDQEVKLFFQLGNADMDAGIAAWAQKFKFDSIRPISAIRYELAGTQVNSWLGPNKGYGMVDGSQWLPYQHTTVLTPPFPEYISGHSTFSQAGVQIFQSVLGTDTFGAYVTIEKGSSKFEQNTPSSDIVFTWPTFSNVGDDSGVSRRIGGIHFATGDAAGRSIGGQVAKQVILKAMGYFNGTTPG